MKSEQLRTYEIIFRLNGFVKTTSLLAFSENHARQRLCYSCGKDFELDIKSIKDKGIY